MKYLHMIALSLTLAIGSTGVAMAKNDKEKKLPPGLQKKVQQGKPLPPGWQKKLAVGETLDSEVYEKGKVVKKDEDKGTVTIDVDGEVIKVMEKSRRIIDILNGH